MKYEAVSRSLGFEILKPGGYQKLPLKQKTEKYSSTSIKINSFRLKPLAKLWELGRESAGEQRLRLKPRPKPKPSTALFTTLA